MDHADFFKGIFSQAVNPRATLQKQSNDNQSQRFI